MSLPNLVIAGAPKCGTSSLFQWLADHPDAFGSFMKETFYLMDKGHPLLRRNSNYHEHGLGGYHAHFPDSSKDCQIIFEATTHYIYQRTALEVLSGLPQPPQIVFLLRKPSERVYSSFQYTKNNLANLKRDVSFSQFVNLVKADPGSSLIEEYARDSAYVLKNDILYSRYVEYIRPWTERFGSHRIHVLLFEDLKRDPRSFMRNVAGRIGIDPAFYDSYNFPVRNKTVNIKHTSLHRRVRKLGGLVPRGTLKSLMKKMYLKAESDHRVN